MQLYPFLVPQIYHKIIHIIEIITTDKGGGVGFPDDLCSCDVVLLTEAKGLQHKTETCQAKVIFPFPNPYIYFVLFRNISN